MPCLLTMLFLLFEAMIMIVFIYISFLIIQLALFNLVIIGIIFVILRKIFYIAETLRWKLMFDKKTKDFQKFIAKQNDNVYKNLGIEIAEEKEGLWLEFLLRDDDKMFEEEIASRRQRIFNHKDQPAIERMKQILNEYSVQKKK